MTKSAGADRARLAELLRARAGGRDLSAQPPVLSFAQERMWFFDQLVPNSPAYNIHAGLRFRGPLDTAALQHSVDDIVRRHEVLRSAFPAAAGAPSLSLTARPTPISYVDVSNSGDIADALAAVTAKEANAPFDLAVGPLLRVAVVRLGEQDHAVLTTMHHIVSDGWSVGLFASELTRAYSAFVQGAAPLLGEVRLQYPAFAAAQRASVAGPDLQRQIDFWRHTMADAPATSELPTDRPRPAVQSYRGGTVKAEIAPGLLLTLRELGKQEGATLFMVLLATFKVLLARHARQPDLIIGTPVAGRVGADAEATIGCFINTVLIRSDLSSARSFRDCVRQVRQASLGAFGNAEVPFDKLVEELHPQRDLSRNPLYQVMFNLLTLGNAPLQPPPGLQVEWLSVPDEAAKLDLTMYAIEDDGRIGLRMVYAADLFNADTMTELLSQYLLLLEQVAAAPDESAFEHSLVTPRAATILPDPAARLSSAEVSLVWTAFGTQAANDPDRVAVKHGSRVCSYHELLDRATMVARTLVASGVRARDVVALSGEPGIEWLAAVLGILRARGVLMLLDPQLPTERRRLMVSEGGVRHLAFTSHDGDGSLAEAAGIDSLIQVEGVAQVGALKDTELPPLPAADDPAYVFFTSGTTGIPKAVLGVHKGLGHFLQWQRETFAVTPSDRIAQLTGLSSDVILREILLPLTSGATLCLRPFADLSADRVLPWLADERVTTLHTVPTLAQAWLAAADAQSLPAIRRTFFAGEPLSGAVVRRWRELCPNVEVINLYGPTETTLAKCFYRVPLDVTDGIQPVGAPMPHTQALVLTASKRLCGIGERGEIAIRTPFRTLGYRNAPDEQRKRFVQNPFTADASDLIYLTGDEGRYRADGILEIAGRVDDQVKLRGARIELSTVTPLDLPTDRPRPPVQTFRGATQSFQLSPETTASLKALSRELGATVHMTLLGVFGAFLRLWSGQSDLAIGSANGNRPRVELEEMLGFFVDTQVLRLDLSGDPTFREMVRRVAAKSLEAPVNSEVPFNRLVEGLRPTRDSSRSPFCDVLFILQNTPMETEIRDASPAAVVPSAVAAAQRAADPTLWPTRTVSAGGADRILMETGTSQFDLTLYVEEGGGGYRGTFEYNTDLFDDETITRALDRFEAILNACVDRPDQRLSELPRLTPFEREQLATWNRTARSTAGLAWHEMVAAQANATPAAVAVRAGIEELTYAQLMERAATIAEGLRSRGIAGGDVVGVFVERSADMVAAMLGAALCGAAYLPLDPAFPADRLEYMVQDAGAAVIITDDALRTAAERFDAPTIVVGLLERGSGNVAGPVDPEGLAYVIYTSGSTGRPKGVEVPHRALANFLESMRTAPGFGQGETLLAVTTLSFDIAALELMLPLVCGGTVVIASRAEASDPVALQAALARSPITVMQATPITWRMLLDAGWAPSPGFRAFCGGEAMPRELAQQLLAHGVELWNLYGPTETTVWSTVERIADASARLSIGRPIANTQVQILDTDGAEMPPGAVGEICIGGAGVARGYRNRPALTAERFVPGGNGAATRMYRTGDRGRWRSDGRLECFGRIDHQVKVRGFRIELGEIEAVLAGDAAVKQAVVHVWDDGPAARLVAYLVPENDASIDVGALRERVAIALPAYMHPASYTVLERWPLTANGKVDRRRLPAPDLAERVNAHYEPPATPIEEAIASLWLELLKVRRVGALDNFFDLGGHSLLATQLASRLRTLLDVDLPLRTVFDTPTVRGLSIAATNAMLLAEEAADAVATSAFNEAR